jgi:hypothetical protein
MTENVTENESAIRRIQGLLERASHPETPKPERESCQELADKLIHKYRVDRAMLNFKKKDQAKEILTREYEPVRARDYGFILNGMQRECYRHAGVQLGHKDGHVLRRDAVLGHPDGLRVLDVPEVGVVPWL